MAKWIAIDGEQGNLLVGEGDTYDECVSSVPSGMNWSNICVYQEETAE